MPHVQIRYGAEGGGVRPASVVVDGFDITDAVLREGFGVEFPDDHHAIVSMRLRVDRLVMDLPAAIVETLLVDVIAEARERAASTLSEED